MPDLSHKIPTAKQVRKKVKKSNEYDAIYYKNCGKNRSKEEFSKPYREKMKAITARHRTPKKEIEHEPDIDAPPPLSDEVLNKYDGMETEVISDDAYSKDDLTIEDCKV